MGSFEEEFAMELSPVTGRSTDIRKDIKKSGTKRKVESGSNLVHSLAYTHKAKSRKANSSVASKHSGSQKNGV